MEMLYFIIYKTNKDNKRNKTIDVFSDRETRKIILPWRKTTSDWRLIGFVRYLSHNVVTTFFTKRKQIKNNENQERIVKYSSLPMEIIQEIGKEGANV